MISSLIVTLLTTCPFRHCANLCGSPLVLRLLGSPVSIEPPLPLGNLEMAFPAPYGSPLACHWHTFSPFRSMPPLHCVLFPPPCQGCAAQSRPTGSFPASSCSSPSAPLRADWLSPFLDHSLSFRQSWPPCVVTLALTLPSCPCGGATTANFSL